MSKIGGVLMFCLVWLILNDVVAGSESMTFDVSAWATGDMNEQYPSDSSGNISNSHVDHFYYYERMPMCMPVLADSLYEGSASRTYDSAVLMLVVAAEGLSGADSMRIFAKRLTRSWSESGVSWNYFWASSDSSWDNPGGDIDNLPCMDSLIVDTGLDANDSVYFYLDTGFVRHMIETENRGWLMMAENVVDRAILQFYTEDDNNAAHRPILTVYYTEGEEGEFTAGRRRRIAINIGE
jgi:hypothetical protein